MAQPTAELGRGGEALQDNEECSMERAMFVSAVKVAPASAKHTTAVWPRGGGVPPLEIDVRKELCAKELEGTALLGLIHEFFGPLHIPPARGFGIRTKRRGGMVVEIVWLKERKVYHLLFCEECVQFATDLYDISPGEVAAFRRAFSEMIGMPVCPSSQILTLSR